MFTQITVELNLLQEVIENELDFVSNMRINEYNPNIFSELGGRLIGLSYALSEIKETKIHINNHIIEILKNTTDGNYCKKLSILEDENAVLQEKIDMLQEDLRKYGVSTKKRNKKQNKSIKELTTKEINDKIDSEIEKKIDKYYFEDSDEE